MSLAPGSRATGLPQGGLGYEKSWALRVQAATAAPDGSFGTAGSEAYSADDTAPLVVPVGAGRAARVLVGRSVLVGGTDGRWIPVVDARGATTD